MTLINSAELSYGVYNSINPQTGNRPLRFGGDSAFIKGTVAGDAVDIDFSGPALNEGDALPAQNQNWLTEYGWQKTSRGWERKSLESSEDQVSFMSSASIDEFSQTPYTARPVDVKDPTLGTCDGVDIYTRGSLEQSLLWNHAENWKNDQMNRPGSLNAKIGGDTPGLTDVTEAPPAQKGVSAEKEAARIMAPLGTGGWVFNAEGEPAKGADAVPKSGMDFGTYLAQKQQAGGQLGLDNQKTMDTASYRRKVTSEQASSKTEMKSRMDYEASLDMVTGYNPYISPKKETTGTPEKQPASPAKSTDDSSSTPDYQVTYTGGTPNAGDSVGVRKEDVGKYIPEKGSATVVHDNVAHYYEDGKEVGSEKLDGDGKSSGSPSSKSPKRPGGGSAGSVSTSSESTSRGYKNKKAESNTRDFAQRHGISESAARRELGT